MKYKNKVNISIVLLIILSMILSPFSSFALEGDASPKTVIMETKNMAPQEKIEEIVKDELNKTEYVEVIVFLNKKANMQALANKVNYMSQETKKETVVDTLKSTAEVSQRGLIKYLETEKANGNVENYEPYYIVNAIYVKGNKDVINELSKREDVYRISYNERVKAEFVDKADTQKMNTSSNAKVEQSKSNVEWGVERIGASEVWEKGIDGSGIVIGLIDSGVHWTHEALMEKWRGYNPNDSENIIPEGNWYDAVNHKKMPYDEEKKAHGTHILGTILGQDPEGKNKIGVAPGAQWIAAKAFDDEFSIDSWLIAAGQWMLAPNGDPALAPDIVVLAPNTLLAGWGDVHQSDDEWFREMVIAWKAAGIIPVFGAGDNWWGGGFEGSIETPASYPESFAVGGVDENNQLLWSTNRGPAPFLGYEMKPNIVAPGSNTRSSIIGGYEGGSNWTSASNAAAHAAGAVALLLSADNTLEADDIEQILEATATPLTDSEYLSSPNYGYGYGLLNIDNAISSLSMGRATVKGKITTNGIDVENPKINYEQESTISFAGQDIINTEISDDNAVAKVELMVKHDDGEEWISIPMPKISGSYAKGQYRAIIDSNIAKVPGITYKIKATDSTGKTEETTEYKMEVIFGVLPNEYSTGFEDEKDMELWSLSGDWEWGEPENKPTPYEGIKLVGTKINGKYSRNSDSYLVSPPIDLRDQDLKNASLRFNHWYDTKLKADFCSIYISNDYGETWNKTDKEFSGRDMSWGEVSVDLGEYIKSETPVFVAFRFTSDSSWTEQGYYIDNVRLIGNDDEAPETVTELVGEFQDIGSILKWKESKASDLEHYNIYRKTSDTEYALIGTAISSVYVDDTVERNITYNYMVKAVDIYQNESLPSEEVEVAAGEVKAIYFESFEQDNGGYITGGQKSTWEWGVPEIDYSSWGDPGPESAYFGEKVWGTNLIGNYVESSSGYVETPAIHIPSEGEYMLDYYQWIHTQSADADRCQVQISVDDSNWINITPDENMGGEIKTWENIKISLKNYAGEDVKFRFVLYADEIMNRPGWYIDNVAIVKSDGQEVEGANIPAKEILFDDHDYEVDEFAHAEIEVMNLDLNNIVWGLNDNAIEVEDDNIQVPVEAIITVVETGTKVRNSTSDGSYQIDIPVLSKNQKFTLRVEANGYATQEVELRLNNEQVVEHNFSLIPASKGNISGRVTDIDGVAIKDAEVKILEDSSIEPVLTGSSGEFTFKDVYEGKYTLSVSAKDKSSKQISVNIVEGSNEPIEIVLYDFVGFEEELIYDDGSAETDLTAAEENSGIAVRMTPNGRSRLKGAKLYFVYPSDYAGDEIGVAIYDSFNGSPGMMIGEPKYITVEYDKWNYVDLSEYEFTTDKDFFVATYQKYHGGYSAPLGIDNDGEEYNRSFVHKNSGFIPFGEGYNNAMIRAIIVNELSIPEIVNLNEINYTNEEKITVEGIVTEDSKIRIYKNGELAKEIESANLKFATELELDEDVNEIYATAVINGTETNKSNEVKVILDKTAPDITVDNPKDNEMVRKENIIVSGSAIDKYLDLVYINGQSVLVDEDGKFKEEIDLDLGENIIVIKALDKAGNSKEVIKKIYRNPEDVIITDIKPVENIQLQSGEKLEISFKSETQGKGYYRIFLPYELSDNSKGTPMTEVEAGYYKAEWIVPENLRAENLLVELVFESLDGMVVREMAMGKITIIDGENPVEPEPSEELPMEDLPSNTVIIGHEAFDIRYLNNNEEAQIKLIEWYSKGKEIYIKLSENIIVNIKGKEVELDSIPSTLTYYDMNGNTRVYIKK